MVLYVGRISYYRVSGKSEEGRDTESSHLYFTAGTMMVMLSVCLVCQRLTNGWIRGQLTQSVIASRYAVVWLREVGRFS